VTRAREPLDVLFVSSSGGHLAEVLEWLPHFADRRWRLVLNAPGDVPADVAPRVIRIAHAERDWRVAWNFVEAFRVLRRLAPRAVVSPGAGCALPFAALARLLAIPYLHVEPRSAVVRATWTGRLVRPFAARTVVQWRDLLRTFPRAACHETVPASSS
jgi:UDP-N-acetylglucosamine:LPS N-acetylglucosamine transferase